MCIRDRTTFSPDAVVSRAQVVTFLNRYDGSTASEGSNPFTDVSSDAYYAGAVNWAVANNVTTGTTATTFSPDEDLSLIHISPYYAGDSTLMMPYNENIAVACPEEGTNLFIDAAFIPKNSQHKEAAEMFINFLNEPNVAAENAEFIGYATPNLAAYALLDSEVQELSLIHI